VEFLKEEENDQGRGKKNGKLVVLGDKERGGLLSAVNVSV
jgi:hypothetical protein